MQHIVSLLYISEFLLLLLIFLYLLFKRGPTFKGGIAFGLLFFIFIPIWVMIFTGEVELSKTDFGSTKISDVILKNDIKASFIFLGYIFFIILYLYTPNNFNNKLSEIRRRLNLPLYLAIYLISTSIIMLGSGILKGGNWYYNRHEFFDSSGSFAVLVAFILNASKILVITTLISKWYLKEIKLYKFILLVGTFTFWDMIFSGNRIYLFCTAILIFIIYLRRFPIKSFLLIPIGIPLVFFAGYFASIFRHMRGPIFSEGFPTLEVFSSNLKRAIALDPPRPDSFFLGISESVNVNVIYDIFNHYDNYLLGSTYLKSLFFFIPRSIWHSKPESITVITAKAFGGSSLVTTIIGEMQMNFSLFGMIILPILLWFCEKGLTTFLRNYSQLSGILLFFFGILIFRMPFSDELLVFVFVIVILKMSNNLGKIKFKLLNKAFN